jgi:hypothetical protein
MHKNDLQGMGSTCMRLCICHGDLQMAGILAVCMWTCICNGYAHAYLCVICATGKALAYIHTYICKCEHTYIRTCMHTCMHTRMQKFEQIA